MLALIGKYGRLGNQLWTYSNALACAMQNDFKILNTAFDSRCLFRTEGLAAHHVVDGTLLRHMVRLAFKANLRVSAFPHIHLGESSLVDFDSDPDLVRLIHRSPLVFFSGLYFYAAESLIRHANHIREYFSLAETPAERVSNLIDRARDECDLLIGVHIRHGDYRSFCDGVMFYTTKEHADIMRFLVDQFAGKKVKFLVCSDESQDPSHFQGFDFVYEKSDAITDLYALSRCDYLFGANSTFSQWASFMGEVPLHVLRWKVQQRYEGTKPAHETGKELAFQPFSPREFGRFSQAKVRLKDVLKT